MKLRQMLTNILFKLQRFMQRRYGADEISYILIAISLILSILSNFDKLRFLYFIALIPVVLSIVRSLSRNITARIAEREKYLTMVSPIKSFLKLQQNKYRDRKTHRYFKCKNCKSTLRVPKGRGKISITCPKCNAKITKKT